MARSRLPIYPGAYAVTATISDPNYVGVATGHADDQHRGHRPARAHIQRTARRLRPTAAARIDDVQQQRARLRRICSCRAHPPCDLNGQPAFGGTLDAFGSASPESTYTITINSSAALRHVVRRVDAAVDAGGRATAGPGRHARRRHQRARVRIPAPSPRSAT